MADVQIILLAAGQSARMGRANKLLMAVDHVPLVRRTAKMLCGIADAEVTVVLGHAAEEVAEALEGLAVRAVFNHHHASGQMSSVHAGLAAAGAGHRDCCCCGRGKRKGDGECGDTQDQETNEREGGRPQDSHKS